MSSYISYKFRSIFLAATLCTLSEYLTILVDHIIIGQMLGEDALAALTLVTPFYSLVIFVGYLIAGGTGIQMSIAMGHGDNKAAGHFFSQAIILSVLAGLVMNLGYFLLRNPLMATINHNASTIVFAQPYFLILCFQPIPLILHTVLFTVTLYEGGERFCNASSSISVMGNVVLSLLLCNTLGMAGVSLATLCANIMALLPLAAFFITSKIPRHFHWYLRLHTVIQMLRFSFGDAAVFLCVALFQLVMNNYLQLGFGLNAVLVFTVIVNLRSLLLAMVEGLGEFITPLISTYRGEKNICGISNTMSFCHKCMLLESLVIMATLYFAAPWVPGFFGIKNAALSNDVISAIRIYIICIPFFFFTKIYISYYLIMNRFWLSLSLVASQLLAMPLILGIGAAARYGLDATWWGLLLAQILTPTLFLVYLRLRHPKLSLPLLLTAKQRQKQWSWNIPMRKKEIMALVYHVETILNEHDIDPIRRNRVMLAIEESQMRDLEQHPDHADTVIECTLTIKTKITLIIRNTGELFDPLRAPRHHVSLQQRLSHTILRRLPNSHYLPTGGDNRLSFEF